MPTGRPSKDMSKLYITNCHILEVFYQYYLNGGRKGLTEREFEQVCGLTHKKHNIYSRLKLLEIRKLIKPTEVLVNVYKQRRTNMIVSSRRFVITDRVINCIRREGCNSFLDPNYSYFKRTLKRSDRLKRYTPRALDFNMGNLKWQ